MQHSKISDWNEIVQHVATHWQIPFAYAEDQMVSIIRHAIYDPALALVISTSGLLKMSLTPEATTYDWVQMCQDAGKDWLQNYRLAEHHCVHKTDNIEAVCHCLLGQIGPLFANSENLLQTGSALVSQLGEEDQDEAYAMLLRALARLARITADLANDDISWLWAYIDSKTY